MRGDCRVVVLRQMLTGLRGQVKQGSKNNSVLRFGRATLKTDENSSKQSALRVVIPSTGGNDCLIILLREDPEFVTPLSRAFSFQCVFTDALLASAAPVIDSLLMQKGNVFCLRLLE